MEIPILAYMYKNAVFESPDRCPLAHAIIRERKQFGVCVSTNHVTIEGTDYTLSTAYTATVFLEDCRKAAATAYDYSVVRTVTLLPFHSKYLKHG